MISSNNILSLIPQRMPFVFVDKLLQLEDETAKVHYTIAETCPLVDNGTLSIAGMLEHIAQSCATFIGGLQSRKHLPIRIGYIGAVKHLQVHSQPRVGDQLVTQVVLTQEVMNISQMDCKTFVGEQEIACATIKLALDEPAKDMA